jgi:tetratricopeptide (TPR) repeat protein
MSSSKFFRPYHYGEYRWDDYLLDIQESIEASASAQTEELHQQTQELERQTRELQEIRGGLEEMREEMRWGFNLIVDRMEQQIQLFSRAVEKLDAIHKTLQSPLRTQAKELFDWGEERFHQGLYDKALEAFQQSEQKNEVNFLLQLRIGTLFLEGRNRECNVIDFPQAEKHLVLAARYAQAEEKTVSNWKMFCGEGFYRAAHAAYLLGEQRHKTGDLTGMRGCLERALEYLDKAVRLRPEFTANIYSQAKCYALLGRKQEALEKFQLLSDRDRRYYSQVLEDGDFDAIRADIEQVFRLAVETPGPMARAVEARLNEAGETLAWATRSKPAGHKDLALMTSTKEYLDQGRRMIRSLDVDLEDLHGELIRKRQSLEEITENALRDRITSIGSQISSLTSRQGSCEISIRDLREKMELTKGRGTGCLFMALTAVVILPVLYACLSLVIVRFVGQYTLSTPQTIVFVLAHWGIAIVSYFVGSGISRHIKNRPLRREVGERADEIRKCNDLLPPFRQQLERSQQEQQEFSVWRASKSFPEVPGKKSG